MHAYIIYMHSYMWAQKKLNTLPGEVKFPRLGNGKNCCRLGASGDLLKHFPVWLYTSPSLVIANSGFLRQEYHSQNIYSHEMNLSISLSFLPPGATPTGTTTGRIDWYREWTNNWQTVMIKYKMLICGRSMLQRLKTSHLTRHGTTD